MKYRNFALLVIFLAITSCTTTYTYNGKSYTDKIAAESAIRAHMRTFKVQVEALEESVLEEAIIYIPDKPTELRAGVLAANKATDAADYVAEWLYLGHKTVAEMIELRNVFESVTIIESDGSHKNADSSGVPVIYLYMPDANTAGWYYVSQKVDRTPLNKDSGNPDPFEQTMFLVESVEALAYSESF